MLMFSVVLANIIYIVGESTEFFEDVRDLIMFETRTGAGMSGKSLENFIRLHCTYIFVCGCVMMLLACLVIDI